MVLRKKYWKVNINAILYRMGLLKYGYTPSLGKRFRRFVGDAREDRSSILTRILYSMTNVVASIMPRKHISLLARKLKDRLLITMVMDTRSSLAFMVKPLLGVPMLEM